MFFKMNDFLNSWKNQKKEILNLNKKFGPLKAKAFPGRRNIDKITRLKPRKYFLYI